MPLQRYIESNTRDIALFFVDMRLIMIETLGRIFLQENLEDLRQNRQCQDKSPVSTVLATEPMTTYKYDDLRRCGEALNIARSIC